MLFDFFDDFLLRYGTKASSLRAGNIGLKKVLYSESSSYFHSVKTKFISNSSNRLTSDSTETSEFFDLSVLAELLFLDDRLVAGNSAIETSLSVLTETDSELADNIEISDDELS